MKNCIAAFLLGSVCSALMFFSLGAGFKPNDAMDGYILASQHLPAEIALYEFDVNADAVTKQTRLSRINKYAKMMDSFTP